MVAFLLPSPAVRAHARKKEMNDDVLRDELSSICGE